MGFDESLARRIRRLLKRKKGFDEKKMFGGLAFMLGDKMCCGVLENKLVARIGLENYEKALRKTHVSPMNFTGRALRGYVYVKSPGTRTDTALKMWIEQAIAFTSTLVSKRTSSR